MQAFEIFGAEPAFLAGQFLSTSLACSITLLLASLLQRRRDRERQDIERRLSLNERIRDLNLRVVAEAIPQMVWRKRADGAVDILGRRADEEPAQTFLLEPVS